MLVLGAEVEYRNVELGGFELIWPQSVVEMAEEPQCGLLEGVL
jgi:hypothetical protein